jgi:hypothetical protein
MHAGGGQAEDDVAGREIRARQQRPALGCADREAREIVILLGIHAGHLGGLAADQRAARLPAAIGDAAHDLDADLRVELAGGVVVEEEQGLGALHDQVVDAHRDEVDADGRMQAALDRDLHLGADAVIGRDQDRIAETGGLQVEQPTEAADLRVGAGPARRAHQRLDGVDHGVARVDVDAGLRIGQSVLRRAWS